MATRVFLVDDEELLTESMEIILTMKGKMDVVGIAKDGREALQKLESTTADIALVDLNMKGMGGLELIPKLKEIYPKLKVLVLTTFYDNEYITKAIAGGADGYLLKDSSGDLIIKAISQILSGQSILAAKVMAALSKMVVPGTTVPELGKQKRDLPKDLTARELEMCGLLAKGYSNQEIAGELFLAEGTVKNYMMNLYDKFGIHDRAALALLLHDIVPEEEKE